MKPSTREEFIKAMLPFAQQATKNTGIFNGTLLVQAILESSGNYNTGGQWLAGGSKLAQEANNFFGIKATPNWKGDIYKISTKEYNEAGEPYYIDANFRKYATPLDSLKDYVKFLKENPRYEKAGVFKAKDVKEQAQALQRAGYSTSPTYADTIASIYEKAKDIIKENPTATAGIGLLTLLGLFFLIRGVSLA
jgi:flagellar protein FlgJ